MIDMEGFVYVFSRRGDKGHWSFRACFVFASDAAPYVRQNNLQTNSITEYAAWRDDGALIEYPSYWNIEKVYGPDDYPLIN
jgi:hypothetical protein